MWNQTKNHSSVCIFIFWFLFFEWDNSPRGERTEPARKRRTSLTSSSKNAANSNSPPSNSQFTNEDVSDMLDNYDSTLNQLKQHMAIIQDQHDKYDHPYRDAFAHLPRFLFILFFVTSVVYVLISHRTMAKYHETALTNMYLHLKSWKPELSSYFDEELFALKKEYEAEIPILFILRWSKKEIMTLFSKNLSFKIHLFCIYF